MSKEHDFAASLSERTVQLPDGTDFKIIEAVVPDNADAQLLLRGIVEPAEEFGIQDEETHRFVGAITDASLAEVEESRVVYLEGYLDGPEGQQRPFTVTVPLPEKPAEPPRTFKVEFTIHGFEAVTVSGDLAQLDASMLKIWRAGRPVFQCAVGVVAFCQDVTDLVDVAEAGE